MTDQTDDPERRTARSLPSIEEVMRKEYWIIEDLAVVLSSTPEGVRTKLKLGTIPKPTKKVGNRNYWKKTAFLGWLDGGGDDSDPWTPPPPRLRRR